MENIDSVNLPKPEEVNKQINLPQTGSTENVSWTITLNVILFISLCLFAASTAVIFHIWVERIMPGTNPIFSLLKQWGDYSMTASLAVIFVFFPLFTKLAAKLKKQLTDNPSIKNLPVRNALSYIMLGVTFLIVVGHIILVMYDFLNGSGTLNAIIHLLVTVIVVGAIFLYFINEKVTGKPKDGLFFTFMTVFGLVAIIYGVSTITSPIQKQKIMQDQQKIVEIKKIQLSISKYYLENNKLPDPSFVMKQTKHVYAVNGPTSYKLCATFDTDSKAANGESSSTDAQYDHPKGNHCFSLKIDKQYYPATAKLVSVKKLGDCQWEVAIALADFTPNSPLTINSKGRVADKCNPNDFVDYSWTAKSSYSIEADGTAVIKYIHGDYGQYTYTYTDNKGKKASQPLEYAPTSIPSASSSAAPAASSSASEK